jgi:hypothetical protein
LWDRKTVTPRYSTNYQSSSPFPKILSGIDPKGLNATFVQQADPPAGEFSKLQKAVSNLRDNLLEAMECD